MSRRCRALERTRLLPGMQAELWPEAPQAISGDAADQVNLRVLEFVAAVDDRAVHDRKDP